LDADDASSMIHFITKFSATSACTPKPWQIENIKKRKSADSLIPLLTPLYSRQMSSSPQPPFPEHVSCPPQLSEQSIAQFPLNLPLLDEDRLSPELAASAAKLRSQFTIASSNAQTLLRSVRDAWIAWHSLPIISENSPGI
jgi:hypothetical protein